MNISWIDWLIVLGLFASVAAVAVGAGRYTRGVADFLAGNRSAGRYLLTLSEGLAALGLAGTIGNFEKFYAAGFAASWWGIMLLPVGMLIALSGWVTYRYRQTRAMTMAQFFEMRYSRRFRVFAGMLAWVSGLLNFGIFPLITATFVVQFCGLPETIPLGGGLGVPTLPLVMAVLLGTALWLTLSGGMVTVMVADFLQAQFVNIGFLVIAGVLIYTFSWSEISATLSAAPAGKSLVDPMDQSDIADFNLAFFLLFAFKMFYNRLGWQGSQGYNCAAKSPHEAKMAGILAEWRGGVTYLIIMLMPICAYVLLHGASHAADAAAVRTSINAIGDPQLREQMTVPLALVRILPVGVAGLFVAAMLAATVGTDTTYMHAWGSIFIQDVILPLRKGRAFTPAQHLRLLRFSVFGVACFAWVWSQVFPLRDYVMMYFLITGAIYLGGSGAVIIGGLYWSRGTTAGAWAGLVTGGVLAGGGALMRAIWPGVPALVDLSPNFPINGAWMAFYASVVAIVAYVGVSLVTCREPFDMNALLNRGEPVDVDGATGLALPAKRNFFGLTDEFTRGDRFIYFLKVGWSAFWTIAFVIGTTLALTVGIPESTWLSWWLFTVVVGMVVGVVTVIWFLWGGTLDLVDLLRTLRDARRDDGDNGVVPAPLSPPAAHPVVEPTRSTAPSVVAAAAIRP